jgi:phosphoethanolamine N-methyltransferase
MYGRGFQSPGQVEALEAACALLDLRPGMRVLDLGSGLGGAATYLARQHHAEVLGLDLSAEMVSLSDERLREEPVPGVTFQHGDLVTACLPAESFDLVWTRDTILYVADKAAVWGKVRAALRDRGQLLVTDFCLGSAPSSLEFDAYLAENGYHLQTIPGYAHELRVAGFASVEARDQSSSFQQSLATELQRLEQTKAAFLASFGPDDYAYLTERWRKKVDFCESGQLAWGVFTARAARL